MGHHTSPARLIHEARDTQSCIQHIFKSIYCVLGIVLDPGNAAKEMIHMVPAHRTLNLVPEMLVNE